MQILKSTRQLMTTGAVATGVAFGSMVLAPSAGFAVPAGGYGDLVEDVASSVVFIEVTAKSHQASMEQGGTNGLPEELQRRFGDLLPQAPQDRGARQGLGAGFIISADGQIVTNHHVVENADTVMVTLSGGQKYEAKVLGSDPLTDIALLKIETNEPLEIVAFGSSEQMRVGDEVVAVGNPLGLGGTVTAGIISAKSRNIHSGPFDDFIQTDASINRGNSGGPLFNNAGEVIGVNTAIYSPNGGSIGIGFAVPSDLVTKIVADLAEDGTITRGWLGVQIKPMSQEVADVLGYDAPKGAVIERIVEDSPAAKADLQSGDIILTFNGKELMELRDLSRYVAETTPETAIEVVVLRKGKQETVSVEIGVLDAEDA